MTKTSGLLALFFVGCTAVNPPPKPPAPIETPPPGFNFQPQPVPLPKAEPEYLPPPPVSLESPPPKLEPTPEPNYLSLPNPKLVAALAVFQDKRLLQCTELYGFSVLPSGPPETETSGLRLVPIGKPCRLQFKDQVIPAMCGLEVSEATRQKTNMVWEQNYYFESFVGALEDLKKNCDEESGAWWDETKGGRYPDFLSVYPTPPRSEMF